MEYTPASVTAEDVAGTALVHPILTEAQAVLIHQALIGYLNSPEGSIASDPEEEAGIKKQVSDLVYFFNEVAYNPGAFPLKSVEDTKRIARTHRAALKGPAQPKSLRGKRKARQAERMGFAKRRRAERRGKFEERNEAVAAQKMREDHDAKVEAEDRQKMIDRFEELARKETITDAELQEVLVLFGSAEAAARAHELRAGAGLADRILGASPEGDVLPHAPAAVQGPEPQV